MYKYTYICMYACYKYSDKSIKFVKDCYISVCVIIFFYILNV